MTKQTEVHLDSRRPKDGCGRSCGDYEWYGDYILQFSDVEAVERSPFRQRLMALGWLGLTEIMVANPLKEGTDAEDNTKWLIHGIKEVQGSELMVARGLGGKLTVTATISADGERQLGFSFGAGDNAECNPDDLNESVWDYLEIIHHSLNEGNEGRNLPIISNQPAN